MTSKLLAVTTLILGVMTSGCTYNKKIAPLDISTAQHSPVRIYVYDSPKRADINQVLILPPVGIEDPELQKRIQMSLFSAAQRRFTVPVRMIPVDSDYAPYVKERNLIVSDGTINLDEISIIGKLMNSDYVICPQIFGLKPYHPQRIDIRLILVETQTKMMSAQVSCVVDAGDQDVIEYFITYNQARDENDEKEDDLSFDIKSPTVFQSFVADMCCSVIAKRLPF